MFEIYSYVLWLLRTTPAKMCIGKEWWIWWKMTKKFGSRLSLAHS